MVTESIKDFIFALNKLDDCVELTINKLSVDGNILMVDLNDLYSLPNLEKLSLCDMTIGEKDLLILESLKKLKVLKLYNCDFSNNDLFSYFNHLAIEELVIDNTEINFTLINKHFNKVIVKNVKNIYNTNCDILDVSKAIMVDFNNLKIEKYKKLFVSKTQYLKNKHLFEINKGNTNIIVMNDFYDEIGDTYE